MVPDLAILLSLCGGILAAGVDEQASLPIKGCEFESDSYVLSIFPRQWHRYKENPKGCEIAVYMTPPEFEGLKTIPAGKRWKLEFFVSVK